MRAARLASIALAALAGCSLHEASDGPSEPFLEVARVERAIAAGGGLGSITCPVLKLANTTGAARLVDEVGLHPLAASAIDAARRGPDGVFDTEDDRWFRDLAALDRVPFVGPIAFVQLLVHALSHDAYACGRVDVQLLAFNDFHGNLEPPSGGSGEIVTPAGEPIDAGGAAFLAAHLARLRARNPENTVVVAAGDLVGGSPLLSALFHDEPTIEALDLAGLDLASVGNHEFDEGWEEIVRLQHGGCHPVDGCQDGDGFSGARFKYLSANVAFTGTHETLFPAYAIRAFGNVRVAFIGLTLEGTPEIVTPAGVEGIYFGDEAETVNALVPRLREEGVDQFVLLLHEGGATTGGYDECPALSGAILGILSRLDPAVRIVVSGHTHAAYRCTIEGRLVTSAASFGRLVTEIDLELDERTAVMSVVHAENVIVTRDVPPAPGEVSLIARYDALAAPLAGRVVGTITADVVALPDESGESPLGDLIADAQLEATAAPELGGSVVAFMNPGGVRADLVRDRVSSGEASGEVTFEESFTIQPFANSLVTMTLTGAEIEALLESQWIPQADGSLRERILQVSRGFEYSWSAAARPGERIEPAAIRLNGAPLHASAHYRVTVNSFLASGGDGFTVLAGGTERIGGALDLDALNAHLGAQSPITPSAGHRITRVP